MDVVHAMLELLAEEAAGRGQISDMQRENERDAREGDVERPCLRIASLSAERVGLSTSGCLELKGMHDAIRRILEPHYQVVMQTGHELNRGTLDDADLLILDMCGSTVELSQHEQERLHRWVRSEGGVAILNCFSMHSRNNSFNNELVHWLGIDNPRPQIFGPRTAHFLKVDDLVSRHPALGELLVGPHGTVDIFENLGSTPFTQIEFDERAKWICPDLAYFGSSLGKHMQTQSFSNDGVGVVGRGVALVCGNLHWLVSAETWDGGLLESTKTNSNAVLLRNIAARAAKALPWTPIRHAAAPTAVRSTVLTVLLVAKRIEKSKTSARPHSLPALPSDIWINILQQALICQLQPRQKPSTRYPDLQTSPRLRRTLSERNTLRALDLAGMTHHV